MKKKEKIEKVEKEEKNRKKIDKSKIATKIIAFILMLAMILPVIASAVLYFMEEYK